MCCFSLFFSFWWLFEKQKQKKKQTKKTQPTKQKKTQKHQIHNFLKENDEYLFCREIRLLWMCKCKSFFILKALMPLCKCTEINYTSRLGHTEDWLILFSEVHRIVLWHCVQSTFTNEILYLCRPFPKYF